MVVVIQALLLWVLAVHLQNGDLMAYAIYVCRGNLSETFSCSKDQRFVTLVWLNHQIHSLSLVLTSGHE